MATNIATPVATPEASRFELLGASNAGRIARGLLGAGIIAAGLTLLPKPAGIAIAALGIVPVAAGVFNLCPIAPLWGGHFFGAQYCSQRQAKPKG